MRKELKELFENSGIQIDHVEGTCDNGRFYVYTSVWCVDLSSINKITSAGVMIYNIFIDGGHITFNVNYHGN